MAEAVVVLKKGEGRTIKAGGAWIFDNEIDTIEKLLSIKPDVFKCFKEVDYPTFFYLEKAVKNLGFYW